MAGLASAAALGETGYEVDLYEARPFLGGRATSYPLNDNSEEVIDNCQHVLLRCCVNLLDFYRRLGVEGKVAFHREFHFVEPGGRISTLKRGALPAPAHFAGAFLRMPMLGLAEKAAIARGLLAIRREYARREDLDRITMAEWLAEKRQPPRAVERFWRQVLVSAVNEELDRMAAGHGLQVFQLGFLAQSDSCEMGIPAAPLGELYNAEAWKRFPSVRLHTRTPVERVAVRGGRVRGVSAGGSETGAETVILAVPFERAAALAPEAGLCFDGWEHSPITGIHLWFDRPVTSLPHGTLLDRTIQWFFNKREGRYLQIVVSASRSLLSMPRQEVIELAVRELGEFLPETRRARIEKAHVVKEARATWSAKPGLEATRPGPRTRIEGLYLAGDWIRTGWPATMEGAVRGGYLAAEAVSGNRFLAPDVS